MAYTRYIERDPNDPGVEGSRVAGFGVPVWAIVGYWRAVSGSTGKVAEDYQLPAEAVEAALDYYRSHKKVIDARIDANAEFAA